MFDPKMAEELLAEAKPGIWEYHETEGETLLGARGLIYEVQESGVRLFEARNPEINEAYPGNLHLASFAPDLARTVAAMHWEYSVVLPDGGPACTGFRNMEQAKECRRVMAEEVPERAGEIQILRRLVSETGVVV